MAFVQIPIKNQYFDSNGDPYVGATLKAFDAGTLDNVLMATDYTGGTTASYYVLGDEGITETSGGSKIYPHITDASSRYKFILFATEALAIANDTAGALFEYDNIAISPNITTVAAESVAFLANLKALDTSATTRAYVSGKTAVNDGWQGWWNYSSGSSATADDALVVQPDSGGGRWLRDYVGAINIEWFESVNDASTDNKAAIDAAIVAAKNGTTTGTGKKAILIPAGRYATTGGHTVDFENFALLGDGKRTSELINTGTGTTFTVSADFSEWRGFRLTDNGTATDGITFTDVTSDTLADNITMENVEVIGFSNAQIFFDNVAATNPFVSYLRLYDVNFMALEGHGIKCDNDVTINTAIFMGLKCHGGTNWATDEPVAVQIPNFQSLTFLGPWIEKVSIGLELGKGTVASVHEAISVHGGYFENFETAGIWLSDSGGSSVAGIDIMGNRYIHNGTLTTGTTGGIVGYNLSGKIGPEYFTSDATNQQNYRFSSCGGLEVQYEKDLDKVTLDDCKLVRPSISDYKPLNYYGVTNWDDTTSANRSVNLLNGTTSFFHNLELETGDYIEEIGFAITEDLTNNPSWEVWLYSKDAKNGDAAVTTEFNTTSFTVSGSSYRATGVEQRAEQQKQYILRIQCTADNSGTDVRLYGPYVRGHFK